MISAVTPQEKVEKFLQLRDWTPAQLARKAKVSRQKLGQWLNGANPRTDDGWRAIAVQLGLTLDQLLDPNFTRIPAAESSLEDPKYPVPEEEVEVPLWPSLPADSSWGENEVTDTNEFTPIPGFLARKSSKDPERIAAKIVGTSMEPRLYEGDLVILELDQTPRPGRMVLARSGNLRTLKVLRRPAPRTYELHPVNPEHDIAVAEEWSIEGFVVAIIRDYSRGRGFIEWDSGGLGP